MGPGRHIVSGFSDLASFDYENTFAAATFGSIIVKEAPVYPLKGRAYSVAIHIVGEWLGVAPRVQVASTAPSG